MKTTVSPTFCICAATRSSERLIRMNSNPSASLELSGLQALHRVAERFIDFCGHNRAPSDQRSCTLRIKQTYAGNHVVAHYAQERVQTKERRNIGQSGLRQRLDELAELADTLGGIADFRRPCSSKSVVMR